MTDKTYTITLKENENFIGGYNGYDCDFYVNSSVIASDIDHSGVKSGDIVRSVNHTFDFSQDVVMKGNFVFTSMANATVPAILTITMSPTGGTGYNVTANWNEDISGASETYFDSYINASASFKINGVAKWSGATNVGNNSFGTHAINWNGGDALTFTTELYQQDLNDSTLEHTTDVEFKIG
tara:strand:+ start:1315 stop:1860 length:546 start_codon:yes stop_codon:yes gene_type:complete